MNSQTPAFPGAEGGGMYANGGRGGTVYYVNTLEDTNTGSEITKEGSLRWCIGRNGKRTILFKVSGTIMLNSTLSVKNGNVTIAGQSAPGDGICIANHPVNISADNVIIRYLRFRMGDDAVLSGGADALGGRFFKNVIIDHCSMSWSTDECVSFYNCDYFTLQWCIISESLRLSTHDKGAHGYGGIWGGTNATFHHNLLAHHDSRNPRFGPGQNIPPHVETVDHRNNVIYNHGNTYGGEGMNINVINNYYKPGPASNTGTARGRILSFDKDKNVGSIRYNVWGQLYVDGNVVNDGKNEANCIKATNDNWTYGVYNQFHSSYNGLITDADKVAMKMNYPFEIKGLYNNNVVETNITTHTAENAYQKVLDYAGASLYRDSHDERIVKECLTGTTTFKGLNPGNSGKYPKAGIIDSHWDIKPKDADESWTPWPVLMQRNVPADIDIDGIPDGWLEKNFPGKKATDLNEEGYTFLEVYLNMLVKEITENQNKNAITSIELNSISKIKLSYNRTDGEINIVSPEQINYISLYNMSGILISNIDGNNRTDISYNTTDLSSGIYIFRIIFNDKSVISEKIMIY